MARIVTQFVCQGCGSVYPKWSGRCEGCGSWNSLVEEEARSTSSKSKSSGKGLTFVDLNHPLENVSRMTSCFDEFDRVAGGGLVPGAVVLLGGDPGIGKSTLLLQVVASLSQNFPVAYVSGEEGLDQIRMRAQRLSVAQTNVQLASSTRIADVVQSVDSKDAPAVLVIDSIQTMGVDEIESSPGTVSQIRAVTQALIALAKKRNITVLLVGHVTKEGMIAGPRVLEHMVDTVLYFEGERSHPFRLLRAVKNRFGPTDEIGVFDMTEEGLAEVRNPSALFLSHRQENVTGSCVFAGMEGTRPLLVEIQALVAPSFLTSPRRAVVGWDPQRLSMILAILEARCGIALGGKDVYLSVLGGLRVSEPAADLAVATALISSVKNVPIPSHMVTFGEMSLSGEVRPVGHTAARLKEVSKLGFEKALIPRHSGKGEAPFADLSLAIQPISKIQELVHWFGN